MTRRVGVIGFPVAHSISPALQQAAFDHYGLDVRYEYWETAPRELRARMALLRAPEVLGAQVTVPHKRAILAYVDGRVGDVETLQAGNVLVKDGGRLLAYNTDTAGFMRALKEDAAFEPRGKRVLLLGAGGATRAIALALAREDIASLAIANRTLRRADEVAALALGKVRAVRVLPLEPGPLRDVASKADLIVNSTTLGMAGADGEGQTPLTASMIPAGALVYDIVYNPPDTPLLREARKAGARTLGGLAMLVYLGAVAFDLWTGREAPVPVMMAAARHALAEKVGGVE